MLQEISRTPDLHESGSAEFHAFSFRDRKLALLVNTHQLFDVDQRTLTALRNRESGAGARLDDPDVEADLRRIDDSLDQSSVLPQSIPEADLLRYTQHRPRKISIYVTGNCNFRCRYCYEFGESGSQHPQAKTVPVGRIREAIHFFISRSGTRKDLRITFFGGEPLLNFDGIREGVRSALEHGAQQGKRVGFSLTTNGSLLTDEIIAFLVEHDFALMLSLDGPEDVNDRCRQLPDGSGTFAVVAERARRLLRTLPDSRAVRVRATLTRENNDVLRVARFFEEFGFREIGIGSNEGRVSCPDAYCITADELRRFREVYDGLLDEYLETVSRGDTLSFDPFTRLLQSVVMRWNRSSEQYGLIPCGICRNDMSVSVDGELYPCHRFVGMDAFRMGSIEEGLDQAAVEDLYERVYANYVRSCGSCWARYLCCGPCPWYVANDDGTFSAPTEAHCDGVRQNIERGLWLYATIKDQAPGFMEKLGSG